MKNESEFKKLANATIEFCDSLNAFCPTNEGVKSIVDAIRNSPLYSKMELLAHVVVIKQDIESEIQKQIQNN